MLPSKSGVSDTLRSPTIVEGIPTVNMVQKNIAFGSYAMFHIGTTNTMKTICVPKIALKVSNNSGWYYFMNIFTGKRMNKYNWK